VSKWVVLCPDCGQEFKVDVEAAPERCPACRYEGEFEIVDEED
jgi:predicted Zn-ribbon and HTH transcriptional regulator